MILTISTSVSPKNIIVAAVFLLVSVKPAAAQWYVFGGPGFAYYQGDVAETLLPNLKMIKFNGKLGVGYNFYKRWDLRLHGSYGNLHGSDAYTANTAKNARGITFTTRVIDAGLTLKYRDFFKKTGKVMNYAFLGFDYMNIAVNRAVSGTAAAITEGSFSSSQFNIPIGFGLGRYLSRKWALVYEFSYHFALTDYLDGTSISGNPKAFDSFIANHLMLVYSFGGNGSGGGANSSQPGSLNVDCPRF